MELLKSDDAKAEKKSMKIARKRVGGQNRAKNVLKKIETIIASQARRK